MVKLYIPMKVYKWDALELQPNHPILPKVKLFHDEEMGVGFIPVFKTRKQAEEYAGKGIIVEVMEAEIPEGYEL